MRRRRRTGSSLVETLVVMAVGGVILALSIKMLQQTFASSHRAEQWLELERNVQQLEYHLRRDLRAADAVELSDPKTLLLMTTEGEVRYKILEDRIERLELLGDESQRIEAYRLSGVKATLAMPMPKAVVINLGLESEAGITQEFVLRQEVGR